MQPCLETVIKVGVCALLIEGRDLDGNVCALGGVEYDVGIPGVTCEQGNADILRGDGLDDKLCVLDGGGGEYDLRLVLDGVGYKGGEVRGAGGEVLGYDFAAQLFKCGLEAAGKTEVVGVAGLGEGVGDSCAVVPGLLGEDCTLEIIEEADTEVVLVACGDLSVGAGDADCGKSGLLKCGGSGDGHARAVGAEHDGNALAYKLGCGRDASRVVGLVVDLDELYAVGLTIEFDGILNGVCIYNSQRFLFTAGAV